jgi:hypothetical protein
LAGTKKKNLISQRAFARKMGVSHTAVQQAIASQRITATDGKIDAVTAEVAWRENTDQSKPRNRIIGDPKHRRTPDAPPVPMSLEGQSPAIGAEKASISTGYGRARAARELYEAQMAKLRLDKERGLLAPVDEIPVAAYNAGRRARNRLVTIPDRLTDILAATSDSAEVRRILEEAINQVCREISDGNSH